MVECNVTFNENDIHSGSGNAIIPGEMLNEGEMDKIIQPPLIQPHDGIEELHEAQLMTTHLVHLIYQTQYHSLLNKTLLFTILLIHLANLMNYQPWVMVTTLTTTRHL